MKDSAIRTRCAEPLEAKTAIANHTLCDHAPLFLTKAIRFSFREVPWQIARQQANALMRSRKVFRLTLIVILILFAFGSHGATTCENIISIKVGDQLYTVDCNSVTPSNNISLTVGMCPFDIGVKAKACMAVTNSVGGGCTQIPQTADAPAPVDHGTGAQILVSGTDSLGYTIYNVKNIKHEGYIVVEATASGTCGPGACPGTPTTLHLKVTINVSENGTCSSGSCSKDKGPGPLGSGDSKPDINGVPVSFNLNLGHGSALLPAGNLALQASLPSFTLPTPNSLFLTFSLATVQTFPTNGGTLSQIASPDGIVNINTINSNKFQLLCYGSNAVGSMGTNGYATNGTPPVSTWTIENPNGSNNCNQLFITESRTGASNRVFQYTYYSASNAWTLLEPDALTSITTWNTTNATNPNITNYFQQIKSGSTIVRSVECIYQYFSFMTNRLLLQRVDGYGSINWTTTYSYDCTVNTNLTNPWLQRIDYPDGRWVYYDHDENNRLTKEFSAFANYSAPTAGTYPNLLTNVFKEIDYYYSLDATYDGMDQAADPQNPNMPMKTVVLIPVYNGTNWVGQEVSREYHHGSVSLGTNIVERCPLPSATAGDSGNLKTYTRTFTTNDASDFRVGWPISISHEDGTASIYNYSMSSGSLTTTVQAGSVNNWILPTSIINGTQTVTVKDRFGRPSSTQTQVISNSILTVIISQLTYTYSAMDPVGQNYSVTDLAGRTISYNFDCCGISDVTDPDGVLTTYKYDAEKRRTGTLTTRGSAIITVTNILDAGGSILQTSRIGSDSISNVIVLSQALYDALGRTALLTNALGGVTKITNVVAGNQLTTTTTYNDGGTRVEIKYSDGRLRSSTGTAVNPIQFQYGAEQDGTNGPWREFTLKAKLDDSLTVSNEWTKIYSDGVGRAYKTIYATSGGTNPVAISYYNSLGQLTQEIDPDGVSTLYTYNPQGALAYTVLDINRNSSMDLAGSDRITFMTNDYAVDFGATVSRLRTYTFNAVSNATSSNLVSSVENSVNGIATFNTIFNNGTAISSSSGLFYPGGSYRYKTNTSSDGTYTVSIFQFGQLLQSWTTNAVLQEQLSRSTNGYDAHGRMNSITDVRTGTATIYYNNADQVICSATTASNMTSQVTSNYFDSSLRHYATQLPDGSFVTNVFTPKGQITLIHGSRQYPVGFGFDAQDRMTTMTNWTDWASGSGARVTFWHYDTYRGWLNSKTYDGGVTGPSFTYTSAGRMATRLWARGTSTTYSYDNSGSLAKVAYTDGTPSLGYCYDRLGHQIAVTNGSSICSLTLNDAGIVLFETYINGPMDGISITNGFDHLSRRTNLATLFNGYLLTETTNNYDNSSRLSTVSDGVNSASYSYLANSSLVQQIIFRQTNATRMTTTNEYDNLNRITRITSSPSASATISYNYQYNSANQRVSVTNEDGTHWIYQYDSLGQVSSGKKYWSDGTPIAGEQFSYNFDEIGNRRSTAVGGDQYGSNLRYASYSANTLNQYTSRTVPGAIDVIGSATNASTVTINNLPTYRYGEFYRAQLSIPNESGAVWQSVTNLSVLNRTGSTDLISSITGSVYLAQTPELFYYDLDGNLTNDGRWTYVWDSENRLISMVSLTNAPVASKLRLTFSYDAVGRRITKAVENYSGSSWVTNLSERFTYDGWSMQSELNATNNVVIRSYLWGLDLSHTFHKAGGIGGLVSMTDRTIFPATSYFYIFDAAGNTRGLTIANTGQNTVAYDYGPFGEIIRTSGVTAKSNPFLFSTKYQDDETSLVFFGHRFYNQYLGRWLSRDPMGEGEGSLLYCFVRNNPASYTDFLGLFTFDETIHLGVSVTDPRFAESNMIASTSAQPTMDLSLSPIGECCKIVNLGINVHFDIYYKEGHGPYDETTSNTHSYKYIYEHEEHHVSVVNLGLKQFEDTFNNTTVCSCPDLYEAWIRAQYNNELWRLAKQNFDFDKEQYAVVTNPYWIQTKARIDANLQETQAAADAALRAYDNCILK